MGDDRTGKRSLKAIPERLLGAFPVELFEIEQILHLYAIAL